MYLSLCLFLQGGFSQWIAQLWWGHGFLALGYVPPIGPVVWISQCFFTPGRVDNILSGSSRGTSHRLHSSPPSILMSLGEFAKGNILIFREDVTQLLKLLTLNLIYTTLHCRYLLQCSFFAQVKDQLFNLGSNLLLQCLQGYIMPLFLFSSSLSKQFSLNAIICIICCR